MAGAAQYYFIHYLDRLLYYLAAYEVCGDRATRFETGSINL